MVERDDYDAYDAFNVTFHETLYGATHNGILIDQMLAIRTRMNAFRRTQLRQDDRIVRSHHEHAGIMDAIARGDGDEASRRMRAHMLNAATALGRYIVAHEQAEKQDRG